DKRGDQMTPAVQLIDAAAAKAKAGAEEVMQEAAAGRSGGAKSDQSAGGRDRQRGYGASKLERESARAASARAAAEPGGDGQAGRGSAMASGQGAAPPHAPSSAGQAPGKGAAGAGPEESSAGAEAPQVSVVPGITRYHRGDCLLIRFLSPDDLEIMTRQAAIE